MSQFSAFVRTRKGQMAGLIVVLLLAVAGTQTLYMKADDQGKPSGAEKTPANQADGPQLKNFVTHAVPQSLPVLALQKADGSATDLQAHKGQWLVVNFWATWCAPCRKEMPQLDALAARYGDRNVTVMALSVDRGGAAKPQAFLDELGVSHMVRTFDPSYKAARAVRLIGLPTTLLIDPDGREVGRLAGEADWDSPQVHALLDFHMNK